MDSYDEKNHQRASWSWRWVRSECGVLIPATVLLRRSRDVQTDLSSIEACSGYQAVQDLVQLHCVNKCRHTFSLEALAPLSIAVRGGPLASTFSLMVRGMS